MVGNVLHKKVPSWIFDIVLNAPSKIPNILRVVRYFNILDTKITRSEERLTLIFKNNFLEYSSDLNHAGLILNWSIGIYSDIVDKNYNLSKKSTFSYFYVANRWKLYIKLASCFGKLLPSKLFVPISTLQKCYLALLLSCQTRNYIARWFRSNSSFSQTFGYEPVAMTTRNVEIYLSAWTMREIYSKLATETPKLWADFTLF